MKKFNPEDALISRRFFPIDQGKVVMHEVWDRYHPSCPFIVNPFNQLAAVTGGDAVIRQKVLTADEYNECPLQPKEAPIAERALTPPTNRE